MENNCNYYPNVCIKHCSDKKLLDGTLEIPCQKPPIENIIYINVKPEILNVICIDCSIVIEGKAKIEVEYCAEVPTQDHPVHYCHFDIYFNHLICLDRCCTLLNNFNSKDITVAVKHKETYIIGRKEFYFSVLLEFNFYNKYVCSNCMNKYYY